MPAGITTVRPDKMMNLCYPSGSHSLFVADRLCIALLYLLACVCLDGPALRSSADEKMKPTLLGNAISLNLQ